MGSPRTPILPPPSARCDPARFRRVGTDKPSWRLPSRFSHRCRPRLCGNARRHEEHGSMCRSVFGFCTGPTGACRAEPHGSPALAWWYRTFCFLPGRYIFAPVSHPRLATWTDQVPHLKNAVVFERCRSHYRSRAWAAALHVGSGERAR